MQGYMAYVDMLIGIGLTLGFFWLVTTEPWHRFFHQSRSGQYLGGRLMCHHCADELADVSRDEWREEVLAKVRRVL